jgi:hypothetical protein
MKAYKSKLAAFALLLVLSLVCLADVLPKCPDTCSPSFMECRCGTEVCDLDKGCGYSNLEGDKKCYTQLQIENAECQIRGWIIAGRLVCIMLLLAPYVMLAMVVFGGVFVIQGSDHPEQRAMGKRWLKNAIIGGLLVIILVQISNSYLGMDLSYSLCAGIGSGTTATSTLPTVTTTTTSTTTTLAPARTTPCTTGTVYVLGWTGSACNCTCCDVSGSNWHEWSVTPPFTETECYSGYSCSYTEPVGTCY